MNFLGMSYVEMFVVGLVAFVFLGPERMVDMAKKLGSVVRELKKMAADLPSIEDLDLERSQMAGPSGRSGASDSAAEKVSGPPDEAPDEDRPVAFKAAEAAAKPEKLDEQTPEDKA